MAQCQAERNMGFVRRLQTIARIRAKHRRQRDYARKHLLAFPKTRFMFWSPVVPVGFLTTELQKIKGLELVVNADYADRIAQLRDLARSITQDTGNDFFRTLQILERLRGS